MRGSTTSRLAKLSRVHMTWRRRIGWTAVALAIFIVIVAAGGYLYLKSASFQRLALHKINEAADSATGGKTTVGRLDLSLSTLTADLSDITMRGTEAADQPPLLHAAKLH